MKKTTVPSRRVNFLRDDDFGVVLWASLGRSYAFISRKTGLTFCQIGYRLKKADLRTTDYRNGIGIAAELIDRRVIENVEGKLRKELKLIN